MNKIGHFSKKGKFLRESLLLIVILSLFLVFVIAQGGTDTAYKQPEGVPAPDPWKDNFEQAFKDNPVDGFSPEHSAEAWAALEKNPQLLTYSPEVAAAAFANDPTPSKLLPMLASGDNINFLNNIPYLFNEFDNTMKTDKGKLKELGKYPKLAEAWLSKRSGGKITKIAEGAKITGYDGANIVTENAEFNPDLLPKTPGGSYEITPDGLEATGKYAGTYRGKITYNSETDTINCDTGFVDSTNTEFACSEAGCSIQVGADGTVKFLQGKGNVNGINAANLRDVSMTNGIINALPDQEGSFIDGTEMVSENYVNYDPKEKIFLGEGLTVKSTSAEKLFRGEDIHFLDKDQNVVATLLSGETRFVLGTGKCLPGSCISVNPETSTITTSVAGESVVKIHSDGYDNLAFKEIKDGSQVQVEEKGVMMVVVDNEGMHPYQDLTDSGKKLSYEIEAADGRIATHVNTSGVDEVCVGEECQACTLKQCLA
jgi:hypothetical protein